MLVLSRIIDLIQSAVASTEPDPQSDELLPPMSEDVVNLAIYPGDATWGNNIQWIDYDEMRVRGWKEVPVHGPSGRHHWRPARPGDRFAYELQNGMVAIFELEDVENERDPRDMFYADVQPIGVLEGTQPEEG